MYKNLQAVILAGGKGARLRNLGKKLPKAKDGEKPSAGSTH